MKVYIQLQPDGFIESWGISPTDGEIEKEVETIEEAAALSRAHKYQDGEFVQDPDRLAEIVKEEQAIFQVSEPAATKEEIQEIKKSIESTDAALMDFILMMML